ncbi:MAG: stalk domain-containing protein [Tissierellia bacterium]|nr:stalk domain-containing protein [Tissierellia bacterium]
MNKFLKLSLIAGLLMTSVLPAKPSYAKAPAKDIIIQVNGQEIVSDTAPFIENNRTMVPIRFISEALGYEVDWDQREQKAIIQVDKKGSLILYNNLRTYYINGERALSDVSPRLVNRRTYVPLRLVAESFGLEVSDSYPSNMCIVIDLDSPAEENPPIYLDKGPEESSSPQVTFPPVEEGKTAIMGEPQATAQQMANFLLSKNPNPKINCSAYELASHYLEEGRKEGIRGDLAFAQAIKETGYFRYGGDVVPEQNNYAGIGTTGGGVAGAYFESPQMGVRAQIQHLKAYASTEGLSQDQIDPRYHLVSKGCAPSLEDLNGKWAVPGHGYGESILTIFNSIMAY